MELKFKQKVEEILRFMTLIDEPDVIINTYLNHLFEIRQMKNHATYIRNKSLFENLMGHTPTYNMLENAIFTKAYNENDNKKNKDAFYTIYSFKKFFASFLDEKNKKYGNSAIQPVRLFSFSDNVEQIKTRIDDKFNRLLQGHSSDNEDVWLDLLGYFIILRVCESLN
jgi:hypothetical protein